MPDSIRHTTRRVSMLRFLWERRSPLSFLSGLSKWPGDVADVRIGRHSITILKHPDLIQQLLVGETERVEKGSTKERAVFFQFLGDGLLNSTGDRHRRHRRLVLPAFHRSRLAGYGDAMVRAAQKLSSTWHDQEVRDVGADFMRLTLEVVGNTLFGSDVKKSAHIISNGFSELTASINRLVFPNAAWILRTPLPFARRLRKSRAALDDTVRAIIRERRARMEDTGDLLSMLLLAEDAERPGQRLSDDEIRDQVMTLFFAGQETVANGLTWALWLLAQHPRIESMLHAELDFVLGGRPVAFADIPNLTVSETIVRETLRLYPPVWTMGRHALEDLDFAGYAVTKGTLLLASQWRLHRDPRWYPNPNTFDPARWTREFRTALPRFAYFPFGGGQRSCIGENFAWAELILVLVTLAQHWKFAPTADTAAMRPLARITLHPDRPVRLRLQRRV